jgi:hypothetical protein
MAVRPISRLDAPSERSVLIKPHRGADDGRNDPQFTEEHRMRSRPIVGLVLSVLFVPAIASAQSAASGAIAGTARDITGAVLPGVTVEAASPALIEKVRSVVTDGNGEYKIVDLRPGTYSVTFTLPGFSILRRDGL